MNQKGFVKDVIIVVLALVIAGGVYIGYSKGLINFRSKNETSDWKTYINEIVDSVKLLYKSNFLGKNLLFVTSSTINYQRNSVYIYDANSQKKIFSKEIVLPSNDFTISSVKYNPKTNEIIYSATNYPGIGNMTGYFLYSMELDGNMMPELIYQFKMDNYYLSSWDIDVANNLVVLNYRYFTPEQDKQIIKKVNIEDGQLTFSKEFERRKNINISGNPEIAVSDDGKYIYELEIQSNFLRVRKIDDNGGIFEKTIPIKKGYFDASYNALSPNFKYVAFYSFTHIDGESKYKNRYKLFVYDLDKDDFVDISSMEYQGGNLGLFWSGDSKKLLFYDDNHGLNYYDFELSKKIVLSGLDGLAKLFVTGWSPSNKYIIIQDYLIHKNFIYNMKTKTKKEILPAVNVRAFFANE